MTYNDILKEVIEEDTNYLMELIEEDTKGLIKEAKAIRDKAFNKEYAELRRLEEQVRWV